MRQGWPHDLAHRPAEASGRIPRGRCLVALRRRALRTAVRLVDQGLLAQGRRAVLDGVAGHAGERDAGEVVMANEFWNKDRPLLMERLGRLLGSTTYRGPDSGGGTPFSARKLTAEAELLVSLKMAQRHPGDVAPWIVYSLALQVDDRQREIVECLAGKLEQGTGAVGHRNAQRITIAAFGAY